MLYLSNYLFSQQSVYVLPSLSSTEGTKNAVAGATNIFDVKKPGNDKNLTSISTLTRSTLIDNATFHLAIFLRITAPRVLSIRCPCSSDVLSHRRLYYYKFLGYASLKNIIRRALVSNSYFKETSSLVRDDSKKPS